MKKTFKIFSLIASVGFCAALNAQQIPPGLLGGMLKSDSWIIRKELGQEEFKGNVSYDSKLYKLRADRVLSERKTDTMSLWGKIYLMNADISGATAELYSDTARFNTATKKGKAAQGKSSPLTLIYSEPDGDKITAHGKTVDFDGKKNTADLKENVKINYSSKQDFILAFADTAHINRDTRTFILNGNVEVDNKEYSIFADSVNYNGAENLLNIEGNYPLFLINNADASGAMQSDKVTFNTETKRLRASGRVSGWIAPKQ